MRHIRLSDEEKQKLENLQKTSTNAVVRQRCLCLLLSAKGNSLSAVGKLLDIHWHTIKRLLDKWESAPVEDRFSALFSDKGQGAKRKLASVAELLPEMVKEHNRNLKPIVEKLESEHGIKVCKHTLRNFLKGTRL